MAPKQVRFLSGDSPALYGFPPESFERSALPDVDHTYIDPGDITAFERALQAPDPLQSPTDETGGGGLRRSSSLDLTKRNSIYDDDAMDVAASAGAAGGDLPEPATPSQGTFVTAQNDWAPVNPKMYRSRRGSKKRRRRPGQGAVEGLLGTRTKDETREGYLYQLSKWPLLFFVFAWLGGLGIAYLSTRLYIWVYEHFFTWRGQRETLRRNMRQASNYKDWVAAAKRLDAYLGRQSWREQNDYAYYDSKTVKRVWEQMRKARARAQEQEDGKPGEDNGKSVDELKALIEACVKNNFVGVENARLYSQTYYGTKNLVQNFVDEGRRSLETACAAAKLT